MPYWRSVNFWLLLVAGWLIAAMCFSLLARLFASFDDMTQAESRITGVTIHLLAVLAGFALARARTQRNEASRSSGFGKPDAG